MDLELSGGSHFGATVSFTPKVEERYLFLPPAVGGCVHIGYSLYSCSALVGQRFISRSTRDTDGNSVR